MIGSTEEPSGTSGSSPYSVVLISAPFTRGGTFCLHHSLSSVYVFEEPVLYCFMHNIATHIYLTHTWSSRFCSIVYSVHAVVIIKQS